MRRRRRNNQFYLPALQYATQVSTNVAVNEIALIVNSSLEASPRLPLRCVRRARRLANKLTYNTLGVD